MRRDLCPSWVLPFATLVDVRRSPVSIVHHQASTVQQVRFIIHVAFQPRRPVKHQPSFQLIS